MTARASAATFVVNSTDDGADAVVGNGVCATAGAVCTLRAAIQEANANGGGTTDIIQFNIPASGVQTIRPAPGLPHLETPVTIDGYTQPGATPNTLAIGNNAVLLVELDGSLTGGIGLFIRTAGATIRGLVINRFGDGIGYIGGGSNDSVIEGNFIGTDPSGTQARPNSNGIGLGNSFGGPVNNRIGGATPAARNLISGNGHAIVFSNFASGNVIQGNYIGTNRNGTAALPNGTGIDFGGGSGAASSGNTIGGTATGAGNVISGNQGSAINLAVAVSVTIQGNLIGVQVDRTSPLGNGGPAIIVGFVGGGFNFPGSGHLIGGAAPGAGNVIAFNSDGVRVILGNAPVISNSIFANTGSGGARSFGLGIDLGLSVGVTLNDPGDADAGQNNLQNFPVITGVSSAGGSTVITGTLNSEASKTYRVQFFSNDAIDAASYGEGQTFIGEKTDVTTDASGNVSFSVTLPAAVSPVQWVTATATDPDGNTSEFSRLEADLVLTHTDAPDPASVNQDVTHTLTVTNKAASVFPSGPATLRYTLASGATFVSATGGVTPVGGVATFDLGTIVNGASVTRTVVVRYATAGAKNSSAAVTSVVIDPLTSDNTAAASTTVVAARFSISGEVRDRLDSLVPGVTMTLSGSASATTTTDADGHYVFPSLEAGGTYTVTPSRTDFQFSPPSQTFPNLQRDEVASFFLVTTGKFTRYFAEGAVSEFFDTRIALLNATGTPATAKVTFLTADLQIFERTVPLAGIERVTINPKELGLTSADFSTVVESDQPIIADRTMEWSDVAASSPAREQAEYGSHAETSIAAPLTTWYLAEGATIGGFDLFYLLQNATDTDAQVTVQYLLPVPQAPVVKSYVVAARSRFNIWVNKADARLDDAEVSAVITSTNNVPLIVERAMYLNTGGQVFRAGHESAAVEGPALEWFLAEGATGEFFDLFILVANPNAAAAAIEANFLKPDGSVTTRTYQVAGQSRFNIWVDFEPGLADTAVSTTIRSTNNVPVIVERAMWWPLGGTQWYEGHNSAGALRAGTKWGLADGELIGTGETYVLIANTSAVSAQAQVTLTFESGAQATRTFPLAPTSRLNVDVRREFPGAVGQRFGVIVESLGSAPAQIVVERAMYKDANGIFWDAGSNVVGTRLR